MIKLPQSISGKPLLHSWCYKDLSGAPIGAVGRYQIGDGVKEIIPFFKHNGSKWAPGFELLPRPLFGLDKLAKHPKNKIVFITEGEKAAAALHGIDVCAVTSSGGARAASKTDWLPLCGYSFIYLMPDCDKPGEDYIRDIYKTLSTFEQKPQVKVVRLCGLNEGDDVVDWLRNIAPEWNGLTSFPMVKKNLARSMLSQEVKKSAQIPLEWEKENFDVVQASDFEWELPNEIATKIPDVDALLPNLMPPVLAPWLNDVAVRMQTPPDFATVSAIVIFSSIIGAGCAIRPKKEDDWEVIPNVWGACIGRPSVVLKSPSMKEPMRFLEKLQAKYGELYKQEKQEVEFESLANKSMLDDIKTQLAKIAKGSGNDRITNDQELKKLKADFMNLSQSEHSEPAQRLFKTNETSIQSMTVLQQQNPRGILFFRDELTGLLARWDREDCADERAYFLEGWNGNGTYTDCKVSRGITDAKQICISLLGGIQPDKLMKYLYQAIQGNNDGLLQRLQLAVWPDEPKNWKLIDIKPDKKAMLRADTLMQSLASIDFSNFGAEKTEHDDRPYFRFDDAGQEIFNHWLTELQTVKIVQEDNPLMVEHFGKFRSLMPSLSLIFHCIEIADGTAKGKITAQSAKLAVAWCKYLESHARRIYAMAQDLDHEAAMKLSKKIKDGCLPSPFTTKFIYDKGWHGLKDKNEVEAACNILIDENWLTMTRKPRAATGRPPLPEYHINPVCITKRVH